MVKKSSNVQIVCSDIEKQRLRELADSKGVNISVVVRECIKRIIENHGREKSVNGQGDKE